MKKRTLKKRPTNVASATLAVAPGSPRFRHEGWAMVLKNGKGWVPGIFQTPREAYDNAWRPLLDKQKLVLEYVRIEAVRVPKAKAKALLRDMANAEGETRRPSVPHSGRT